MVEWMESHQFQEDIELKPFTGVVSHTGFFSTTSPPLLFAALFMHLAAQGDVEDATDLLNEVDTSKSRVKFTLELPETLEAWEDEEEEQVMQTCTIQASVRLFEPGAEGMPPKKVYMDFKRKSGSLEIFGRFLKKVMADFEKFMEAPATETTTE